MSPTVTRTALCAVALLCGLAPPATAQVVPQQEFGIWSAALTTLDLTRDAPGPSLWLDAHVRRNEPGTTMILRPGAGVRIAPWLSLWAGYAWVPNIADQGGRSDEHRSWQQVIASHTIGNQLSIQARLRTEQRFGEGGVGHRARQFLRVGWIPPSSPIGLVVWDEVFVGLNDVTWGPRRGYDQNRLFVGAAIPIDAVGRFEAGYLLVHLNRAQDKMMSVLAVNLFVSPRLPARVTTHKK